MYTWDALSVNANRMKILWNNTKCLNYVFLLEQLKLPRWEKPHANTVAWSYGNQKDGAVVQSFESLLR